MRADLRNSVVLKIIVNKTKIQRIGSEIDRIEESKLLNNGKDLK